jgi:Phage integrase, N-terminal SAM-like domain
MSAQTPVPSLLRSFFEDYLAAQRDVSQNTIYAYRDAIKLFLRFAARHRGRQLLRLQFADLGADTVLAFLTYLESDRKTARPPGTASWSRSTASSPTPPTKTPGTRSCAVGSWTSRSRRPPRTR